MEFLVSFPNRFRAKKTIRTLGLTPRPESGLDCLQCAIQGYLALKKTLTPLGTP